MEISNDVADRGRERRNCSSKVGFAYLLCESIKIKKRSVEILFKILKTLACTLMSSLDKSLAILLTLGRRYLSLVQLPERERELYKKLLR